MPPRIFITVADVSGDLHAAQLIHSLRQLRPDIVVEGHGGAAMRAAGATIHNETVTKAAMGLGGVGRAAAVWRMLRWTGKYYQQAKPDLHICIDSSAMNLPFAKMARSHGVPVLYYIVPQLWASRSYRVKQMRRYVNRAACILPFEEDWFRSRGVDATFVGHPLFDELPPNRPEFIAQARAAAWPEGKRFPDAPPVIGIIPGSRKGEIAANLPHLLEVAGRIRDEFPDVKFVIPTTAGTHAMVSAGIAGLGDVEIGQDAFDRLVAGCDLCLCKSGTATLHVAAYQVPMIVVYRVNWLLGQIARRFIVKTKHVALVNLLANGDLVSEFFPWCGPNAPVIDLALDLLRHPKKLQAQRQALRQLIEPLDKPGASMNAARMALETASI